METRVARRMWRLLEPYHAVAYFAPEVADAMKAVGLKGWWMGYFAGRVAPMGPVAAPVVVATFYGFRPSMVGRAIPDAWGFAAPEAIIDARLDAVDAALRRQLGGAVEEQSTAEAASIAGRAVEGAEPAGRPLGAATAAVALRAPDERPHVALWQYASALRELRGDGHVAALVLAGIDPCESHVTLAATGAVPREALQRSRQWTDEEWVAAEARLRERGWLESDGDLTEAGRAARAKVEDQTDRAALRPWVAVGQDATDRLAELVRPLSVRIAKAGDMPFPNPIGVPPEDD